MLKGIFDITIVDKKTEEVVFITRLTAVGWSSPEGLKNAAERAMKEAEGAGVLVVDGQYHVQVMPIGPLPNSGTGIVVPSVKESKVILANG